MGSSIGGLVGGAAGAFIGGPQGAMIGSQLGGMAGSAIGGSSGGSSAAGAQGNAGASIYGAGQYGQQAAQFRPVGMTTGFGKSNFGYDQYGRLTEAGYTLSPELKAIQDKLMGQAGAYDPTQIAQAAQPLMGGASTLFGLGGQYLATSPEAARQEYMATQQAALAPGREQQLANIRNQLFQTGRTGLATGGTEAGGMQSSNPELQAYYNSIAQQNLNLGTQAEAAAQQRQAFGAGLFGTGGALLGQVPSLTTAGYSPLQTQLGLSSMTETMGQGSMDLASALAAQQSTGGYRSGALGLEGARQAAPYQIQQQSYNPLSQLLGGTSSTQTGQLGGSLGNWFGDLIGGGSGMGLLNSSKTSGDYMNAIGGLGSGALSGGNPYAGEWWMGGQ